MGGMLDRRGIGEEQSPQISGTGDEGGILHRYQSPQVGTYCREVLPTLFPHSRENPTAALAQGPLDAYPNFTKW